MNLMGIEAVYPKKRLSVPGTRAKKYPYLLKGLPIERPDQVWATDIAYIRMRQASVYLVAIMDWFSRYLVSWAVSITTEADVCIEALQGALDESKPEIFNSDQGSQFTSAGFTGMLEAAGIRISMDGRGRAFDNIFVERLWRSVKYEEVYLKEYLTVKEAAGSLGAYFRFYNERRLHQALGYQTPYQMYTGKSAEPKSESFHPVPRSTFPP
jgi:putative transposase